jgi:hypothetical protein
MVRRFLWKKGNGLTIILVILYGQKFMMCYNKPWIQWLFSY